MKQLQLLTLFALFAFTSSAQNVGIGTPTPHADALLHIDFGNSTTKGILFSGTFNSGSTVPNLGLGSRMMFYPGKAAFRAGYVDGTQWNSVNIGDLSTAMGNNTIAGGIVSTAMGFATTAVGNYSTAIGSNTYAGGIASTALGFATTAAGTYSTALGTNTTAGGVGSAAFGDNTKAKGYASVVMGMFNDSILLNNETLPNNPATPLFIIGNGTANNIRSNAMVVQKNGNVGIGISAPTAKLHVNGSLRVTDGLQGVGKVLTSDINGNAGWSSAATVQQNTLILSENGADANLISNGYSVYSRTLLPSQTAQTSSMPAEIFTDVSEFLEGRAAPSIVGGPGNKFIVFGGHAHLFRYRQDGAIYDAVSDSWTNIPAMEVSDRRNAAVVWTGSRLLVYGGISNATNLALNTGKIYDPVTGLWAVMTTTGSPSARTGFGYGFNTATNEFILWGGNLMANGGRYNLTSNTWSVVTTTNAPPARYDETTAVGGGKMMIYGGVVSGTGTATGYLYDFATNTWSIMAASGLSLRRVAIAEYTGVGFIVWSGYDPVASAFLVDGSTYNTGSNTWTPMSNTNAPSTFGFGSMHSAYANNSFVVLLQGDCKRYHLPSQTWINMPSAGRDYCDIAANGLGAFLWGGFYGGNNGYDPPVNTGLRFFWNATTATSYTTQPRQLFLYKKN